MVDEEHLKRVKISARPCAQRAMAHFLADLWCSEQDEHCA